jgi:hypothetical protein
MTSVGLKQSLKPVFKTKPKLNQVDKLIARTRAKPVRTNESMSKTCCVKENFDDPFEKAMLENEKILMKIKEDQLKLAQFKKNVKERLKVYKHVEHKIDEDRQLKIDRTNKLCFSGGYNNTNRAKSADVKFRSVSAECFRVDKEKKPTANKIQPKPIEKISNF